MYNLYFKSILYLIKIFIYLQMEFIIIFNKIHIIKINL